MAKHIMTASIFGILGIMAASVFWTWPGLSSIETRPKTETATGENEGTARLSGVVTPNEIKKDSDDLESRMSRLEDLVTQLKTENVRLEEQRVELSESLESLREKVADGPPALLGDFTVIPEGQVRHKLTNQEVTKINSELRKLLDEFKQQEQENAYVESESEDGYVIRVPALEHGEELEKRARNLFLGILGPERGQRFFDENRDVLSRELSYFGRYTRVIVVRQEGEILRITDRRVSPEGTKTLTSDSAIRSPYYYPPELDHLLQPTE